MVKPLERVVEASEWFVRTPSLRAMFVATDGALRTSVLEHICASELLEECTTPFFVLEAPVEPDDDGWALRGEELRGDWEAFVSSAPDSAPVAGLWPPKSGGDALTTFALEVHEALARLPSAASGLVLVLAPVWVRDAAAWQATLTTLLSVSALGRARFVVVEADTAHARPAVEKLGAAGEQVDARVDEARMREEMQARAAAMAVASPQASGWALLGGAGPRSAPPPRRRGPRRILLRSN